MQVEVPESILHLLLLVGGLSLAVTGYSSGLKGARLITIRMILVLLVSATLFVIIDLDRPRQGLITVGQSSLQETLQSIQAFRAAKKTASPRH